MVDGKHPLIEESRKLAPGQNATTIQVALGVVSAVMWMIENPKKGFCLPDDLPHEFVLSIAKPYLGEFWSGPSDWTPLKNRTVYFRENPENEYDHKDVWQLKTSYLCDESLMYQQRQRKGHEHNCIIMRAGRFGLPHRPGSRRMLEELARKEGTPIFIIDHAKIRENYREFKKFMPKIQVYFAVKANSNSAIVKTLLDIGASFDVASMPEFMIVHEFIRNLPDKERQDWIWDRIIYANTIKPIETLEELNQYKPLVTFDNIEELKKIRAHAPQAGLVLRSGSRTPVRWSNSPQSSVPTRARQWILSLRHSTSALWWRA